MERTVPQHLQNHRGFARTFQPGKLTLGLSAITQRITLGSAGYVSPLREPILTAKEAASIGRLSGGRFVLGPAEGDRPSEHPAFGKEFDNRANLSSAAGDDAGLSGEHRVAIP